MNAPLLEASHLRVDAGGAAVVDGLSLRTSGERVLVLGAARALFEAASGARSIAHGDLRVRGELPREARRRGLVAGAALDAPMPPDWTARAYVTWSARLAALPGLDAAARATEALARMELGELADAPLGKATAGLSRATAIAAALVTGAEVILLDDPQASLDDPSERHLAEIVAGALEGRAWVIFAPRVSLASPLALRADEAHVVLGSSVWASGPPAEVAATERRYAIQVHGDAAALARVLAERGAGVEMRAREAGATRIMVDLAPSQTTSDLLACAEATATVIVDLRPLARAFA